MRRVTIVGSSGAGKSTLSGAVAGRIGVQVIDLDELMHGPDWTPTPTPEFRRRVVDAMAEADSASAGWVIAGNYRNVADLTQGRADTIVWLDLPRRISISRLIRRSLRRAVTREVVWGGNRERLRDLVSRDPRRNVVLWSWRNHPLYARLYAQYADGDFWAHASVHRLRTGSDVAAFLAELPPPPAR